VQARHRLVEELSGEMAVRRLCRILAVNRSWFYAAEQEEDRTDDTALRDRIEQIVLEFPGYGYRRVTATLHREEWLVNHKRVLRVMREESLLCQLKRHWVTTTDSHHALTRYPNLAKDLVLTGLNQLWIADITYVRLPRAFTYLAAILDAFSRKVIGWALSRWIDTPLTLQALERALATREVRVGLVHHSDQGVQYAATAYVERLHQRGIAISMAGKGNPYDNAKAESFFKTLKQEEVYLKDYQSFADAEANLAHFIEDVYNVKRLHSALAYRPPAEFEKLLSEASGPDAPVSTSSTGSPERKERERATMVDCQATVH
jgi:transposase InsO family protein